MEQITFPNEVRANTVKLTKDLQDYNKAISKLVDIMTEQFPRVGYDEPKDLTCILRAKIYEKIQAVEENECFGEAERADRLRQWDTIRQSVNRAVVVVEAFYRNYPKIQLQYDWASGKYTAANADELIHEESTHNVPEEAEIYKSLIDDVRLAISHLRKYERENDLKVMRLATLLDMKEVDLIRFWLNGDFHLDTRFLPVTKEGYYAMTPQY